MQSNVTKTLRQTATLLATPILMLGVVSTTAQAATFSLEEATIANIDSAFDAGALSSEQLVQLYLNRIETYDEQGPEINSFMVVNPNALQTARELDQERQLTGPRSPLHGIPVLLKDNIDTFDLPTTAGSLALQGSVPPDDAFITKQLRDAGAVIIGKANLTEFANFMAFDMPNGYSSLGGQVLNPYGPGRIDVSGSSSGSAAAVAANLTTVAIGTETSGSILSPSNNNSLVGIKPTVGLVSRDGIIPIASSQDTAGPIARTVEDAAILLGTITGADPSDPATAASSGKSYTDYTQFLDPNGLKGARIGISRLYYEYLSPEEAKLTDAAISEMKRLGAEIIDPTPIPTAQALDQAGFDVLVYEFKADLNAYLASLGPDAPVRSLADIIAFNNANPETALKYGQEILELSEATSGTLTEPEYINARETDLRLAKTEGIDAVIDKYDLDALLFPDSFGAGIGAKAGYPSVIVPAGYTEDGSPFGVTFLGEAFSESTLIKLAYSYEQATELRLAPTTTPALAGEEFNYQPVPEPSENVALTLLSLSALLGLRFIQKRKIQGKDKLDTTPSDAFPALPCRDEGF